MHPLLTLLATRPQLLLDHAQGYAALVQEESGQAFAGWRKMALLQAASLGCLVLALGLAGVALMLWALLPPAPGAPLWILLLTPLLPLLLALVCLLLARRSTQGELFQDLSRQIRADVALLRAANLS